MKKQDPSIFNDIVGPFMIGPSSSHTCAPSRIGFLSQQLLDSPLKWATIDFAKEGAYTNMYEGQKSDLGFVNGLLGNRPEDPSLKNSLQIAKERNIDITFKVSDYEAIVPNIAKLTLTGEKGDKVVVYSDSTGSGTIKLLKINDFDVSIIGDCFELLIVCNESNLNEIKTFIHKQFPNNEGIYKSKSDMRYMINLKLREPISKDIITKLKSLPGVSWVKTLEPIITILSNHDAKLPFRSAAELLEIAKSTDKELWKLAVEYEMARSGWTKDKVIEQMVTVIKTMETGVERALEGNIDMDGIINPTAGKIDNYLKTNSKKYDMGVLETAVTWAIATMEYSNAMGVVLCAPTGGSAGVFPGAILGVAKEMNWSLDDKIRAMFVASIIGIVMSKDYTFSAELYGCQVEPGAASAMAAGALVDFMGGTPKQSLQAASSALQNILGTICDPVAGLVQIPCINRNAISVGNAVISANMVLGGFDPLIPLDEVTETMFRVGRQLPSELRCTCKGGLCITPSGQRLAKEQDKRNRLSR